MGLFQATEDQLLYPSPHPISDVPLNETLEQFQFLGRVLGKAVFEDILVEPQFSPTFLNKLLGKDNIIDDLYTLDPEVYHNLVELKSYAAQGEQSSQL
jgi:ubiquitin-protein ligase E3 C